MTGEGVTPLCQDCKKHVLAFLTQRAGPSRNFFYPTRSLPFALAFIFREMQAHRIEW
jgi:hypothetical protein